MKDRQRGGMCCVWHMGGGRPRDFSLPNHHSPVWFTGVYPSAGTVTPRLSSRLSNRLPQITVCSPSPQDLVTPPPLSRPLVHPCAPGESIVYSPTEHFRFSPPTTHTLFEHRTFRRKSHERPTF
ncbi:hypothetical protein CEXT_251451 [Caerostris extrusa]|uniref:Uncharacterized protein n=1 Tax=Caerostris extrusa TaxID=172846 RepID=A0AAV4NE87_CAEEX|nr:hypothetical protein CEXT_251451 [Caerostris extrusa]